MTNSTSTTAKIRVTPEGRDGVWLAEKESLKAFIRSQGFGQVNCFWPACAGMNFSAERKVDRVLADIDRAEWVAVLTGDAQANNRRHALTLMIGNTLNCYYIGRITREDLDVSPFPRCMTPPDLLADAQAAIRKLRDLTRGFDNGSTPDVHSVLALNGELVWLYEQVGTERSRKFRGKEGAHIRRKVAAAQQYLKGRADLKRTAADSSRDAILAVGEELQQEAETAGEFELYRVMLHALQNAIDYARSVASFLKEVERRPSGS